MPRFTRSTKRTPRAPAFFAAARTFYGDAFGARKRKQLEEAMTDWADLPEEDRSFALAHLLYLNLMAQAGVHRLLAQTRNLLDEMAEEIGEVADRAPEPDGDDDLFDGGDGNGDEGGEDDGEEDPDDDLGPVPGRPRDLVTVSPPENPAAPGTAASGSAATAPTSEVGELLDGDEADDGGDDDGGDDGAQP